MIYMSAYFCYDGIFAVVHFGALDNQGSGPDN